MTKRNGDCCCDRVSVCCGGLPKTLFATFSNVSGCECIDGLVVQLDWVGDVDDQRWEGTFEWPCPDTGTDTGGTATLIFRCGCTVSTGSCADFPMEIEMTGGVTGCEFVKTCDDGTVCDCNPLHRSFDGIGGGCVDCDDPVIADFDIDVTE